MWYQRFRDIPFTDDLKINVYLINDMFEDLICQKVPFDVYDFWDQVHRDKFYHPFQSCKTSSCNVRLKYVSCVYIHIIYPKWFYLKTTDIWNPPKLTPGVLKWTVGRYFDLVCMNISQHPIEEIRNFNRIMDYFDRILVIPERERIPFQRESYLRKVNMRTGECIDSITNTFYPYQSPTYMGCAENWIILTSQTPFSPLIVKNPLDQFQGLKKILIQKVIDLDLPTDDLPLDLQEEIREVYVFQKLRVFPIKFE